MKNNQTKPNQILLPPHIPPPSHCLHFSVVVLGETSRLPTEKDGRGQECGVAPLWKSKPKAQNHTPPQDSASGTLEQTAPALVVHILPPSRKLDLVNSFQLF